MEELFLNIQKQIAEKMPELSLIDEDYGQLETEEDVYPVTFPCVLINTPQVVWTNLVAPAQQGELTLTIRLAIDCYDDTHYGSTQEGKVKERIAFYNRLNRLLHGFNFSQTTGYLVRQSTRFYSLPGAIKVYESTYGCPIRDVGV